MSLRDQLEQYLHLAPALRDPANVAGPTSQALHAMVDGLLRRVLDGESPRTVFNLKRQPQKPRRGELRELAAACEVARLMSAGGSQALAVTAVAVAFNKDDRTVQRWLCEWDVRQVNVPEYIELLRDAQLL